MNRLSLSSEDVARVTDDLSHCRTRLDAGIEENRRNRQFIEELNEQLQKFRKRAKMETPMDASFTTTTTTIHNTSMPSLTIDIPLNISETHQSRASDGFGANGSLNVYKQQRHRSFAGREGRDYVRIRSISPNGRHRSSPRLSWNYVNNAEENIDDVFARLKEELFKNNTLEEVNDMLREENDAALAANQHLRIDVSNLSRQLQLLQQQQHSETLRIKSENTRYRNQVENQHRKLIDLWKEFSAVKRQLQELKTSTANDMDRQMTEFTRCATLMRKAIRNAEIKGNELNQNIKKDADAVLDETLRQLNSITEDYMKSEEKSHELQRQLKLSTEELSKARRRVDELTTVVEMVCRDAGIDMNADVARMVRKRMRADETLIQELRDQLKHVEVERDRARNEAELADRKRRVEVLELRKKGANDAQRDVDLKKVTDDARKMKERLEEQLESQKKLVATTQQSLADAHRQHKIFIEELMTRHRDELADREREHAEVVQLRDNDEAIRHDKLKAERDRMRRDMDSMRDGQRELKAQLAANKIEVEDLKRRCESLEDERRQLQQRLDEETKECDARQAIIDEYRMKVEEQKDGDSQLREKLAENQAAMESIESEAKLAEQQVLEFKSEIVSISEQLETATMEVDEKNAELQEMRKALSEKDVELRAVNGKLQETLIIMEDLRSEADGLKSEMIAYRERVEERTRKLAEISGERDEVGRTAQQLKEELGAWQRKFDELRDEKEEIERRREAEAREADAVRLLLDDLRLNFDALTNENRQKTVTIDGLNEEIHSLRDLMDRAKAELKQDMERREEANRQNEEEVRHEFEAKITIVERDKVRVEEHLKEVESKLNEMSKKNDLMKEQNDQLTVDQTHLMDQMERIKEKARRDVEASNEQNEADRMEWSKERERIENAKNAQIEELKERVKNLEKRLADTEHDAIKLREQLDEAMEAARIHEQSVRSLESNRNDQEHDWKRERQSIEEERLKLVEMAEAARLEAARQTATIDQMARKAQHLEEDLKKANASIVERDSAIQALESNAMEMIEKFEKVENEYERLKDELAIREKVAEEMTNNKESMVAKMEQLKRRSNELGEQLREASQNSHNLRIKCANLEEKKAEVEHTNNLLNNKIRQLEIQLMDKTTKSDVSSDLLKKMEQDTQNLLKQAQSEQVKLGELESQCKQLKEENIRLSDELNTVKAAFEAKRESSKNAISDILMEYRKCEANANEASLENQRLRGELASMTTKCERLESRANAAESKQKEASRKFDELQSRLMSIQKSTVESIHQPRRSDLVVEIPRASSTVALNTNTAGTIQDDVGSSVGVTLRFLKERIEQLEVDKAELVRQLDKTAEEARMKSSKLEDARQNIERIERTLSIVTQEKTSLETRVASQRQMYLTNEESCRSKEHDVRNMKARITTLEIHLREKESKISHLKKEIETLHTQLADAVEARDTAQNGAQTYLARSRDLDEQMERAVSERDAANARTRRVTAENENLLRRLEQVEREREQISRELVEQRRIVEQHRSTIDEMRSTEERLRTVAAASSQKNVDEAEREREKKRWEESHATLIAQNAQLTGECDRLRIELREHIGKVNSINLKSVESERRNDELNSRLVVLQSNIDSLKKFEIEWKRLESEMRAELKVLRREKIANTAEIEELKRRALRNDTEKKEIDGIRIRMEREISALKRHVDSLEEEKTRTEKAVREMLGERRAIDKSLAAMERENQQLYRNCSQLQSQIQQLESDAGNRSVAKLAKEHTILESRIASLVEEKRQLQSLLDQRDANHSHKRKMLESQLQLLREQLDAERRKRRTGPTSRRINNSNSQPSTTAFRRTVVTRSISCERITMEQRQTSVVYMDENGAKPALTWLKPTPPISPLSHTDSYTSGSR